MKRAASVVAVAVVLLVAYLLAWPVPVDPVAWVAPENPGYVGPHAANQRLARVERVALPDLTGPEDLTVDPEGTLYTTSQEGWIARRVPGGAFERWVRSAGRPLGLAWDRHGDRLVVADAYRGLVAVGHDGTEVVLADEADGVPIRYADDVVAAADGRLFFTDASTKFGAEAFGGVYQASLLDILEHGGHGRLLEFDPATGRVRTLLGGLQFANGVAMGPDDASVLIAETGSYRVLQLHLDGPNAGHAEVLLDNLPGFPDNLVAGAGGRYWVGLVSERSPIVDNMASSPFARRMVQRLPRALRPEASHTGHLVAFSLDGSILTDLQGGSDTYTRTTGALEHEGVLWITSLHEDALGRMQIPLPGITTGS